MVPMPLEIGVGDQRCTFRQGMDTDIVEILHHQHHTPIALQNRQVTQTGEEMSEGYYRRTYAHDVLEPLESELGREEYPLRIP